MKTLQLQVDPFDMDFDQTRRQELDMEKPPTKKKRPAPVSDDDVIDTPALDPDPDTADELDEDDKPVDLGEDDEEKDELR